MATDLNHLQYRAVPLDDVTAILQAQIDPQLDGYLADDARTRQATECLQSWRWVEIAGDAVIFERTTAPKLRPIVFKQRRTKVADWLHGWFHQFVTISDESSGSSYAIVEDEYGSVYTVDADLIEFQDRPDRKDGDYGKIAC